LFCIACLALLFLPVLSQPPTTLDGSKLTDDIRDESRWAMVNSSFELSLDWLSLRGFFLFCVSLSPSSFVMGHGDRWKQV
jgi:hypothetical protein